MPKPFLALLLILTSPIATGGAAGPHVQGTYLRVAQRGGEAGMSLNQAVQQVQHDTGGRVLSADTVNQNGRTVHRIKVLMPSGQVRVVTIDAQARVH